MVNPTITLPETFKVTHEQFKELAIVNRDLRLERTATAELIVMPPTGIYRQGQNVEVLDNPISLSGEDVLPGFILDLTEVWE